MEGREDSDDKQRVKKQVNTRMIAEGTYKTSD